MRYTVRSHYSTDHSWQAQNWFTLLETLAARHFKFFAWACKRGISTTEYPATLLALSKGSIVPLAKECSDECMLFTILEHLKSLMALRNNSNCPCSSSPWQEQKRICSKGIVSTAKTRSQRDLHHRQRHAPGGRAASERLYDNTADHRLNRVRQGGHRQIYHRQRDWSRNNT